jgi:hypothetical protein
VTATTVLPKKKKLKLVCPSFKAEIDKKNQVFTKLLKICNFLRTVKKVGLQKISSPLLFGSGIQKKIKIRDKLNIPGPQH